MRFLDERGAATVADLDALHPPSPLAGDHSSPRQLLENGVQEEEGAMDGSGCRAVLRPDGFG